MRKKDTWLSDNA